jgi:ApbE superfamily uncharacterized protein (UPF0280 family)
MNAVRALLPDGRRWHFQQGPIDLVIEAWGEAAECAWAYEQAWARFESVLTELVAELPMLRSPVSPRKNPLKGAVARRMWRACAPFAPAFITPMAAVAGAVADEVLAAMRCGGPGTRALDRAYVNNGGDIALHLAPGTRFETGIVGDLAKPKITATATVHAADDVRGIATSGWRGRSFSRGIADAVTVLARDAAAADAAATLIANAVDVDDPAIRRRPARDLDPDSDLGEHLVTVEVGPLGAAAIGEALGAGAACARRFRAAGHIEAAILELAGRRIAVGGDAHLPAGAPALAPAPDMAWSLRA